MKRICAASLCAAFFSAGQAGADALNREGFDAVGLLFAADDAVELRFNISEPRRGYRAAEGTTQTGAPAGGAADTDASRPYLRSRIDAKVGIGRHVDCLARYHQPWGLDNVTDAGWAGRHTQTSFLIESDALDATCSLKTPLGEGGFFRVLGGVRATTFEAVRTNVVDGALSPVPLPQGVDFDNAFDLETGRGALGWRAGLAYEIPDIALRAQLVYDSAIPVALKGVQRFTFPNGAEVAFDARTEFDLPQSLEFRLQSGVAPGWLVSAAARWREWGELGQVVIDVDGLPDSVLDTGYSDAIAIEFGVAHQINDRLAAGAIFEWEEAIGGGFTDAYTLGAGVEYALTEEVMLGAVAGSTFQTSSSERTALAGAETTYDNADDFGIGGGVRLRWSF